MKAVLVLDEMPKDCEHCMLVQRDYGNDYWCQFVGELEFDEMTKIHERCPLKEMPQEKEYREIPLSLDLDGMRKSSRDLYLHRLDVDNSYVMGWNDCIKVIENGNTSSKADELFHDLLSKLLEIEK